MLNDDGKDDNALVMITMMKIKMKLTILWRLDVLMKEKLTQ